MRLRANLYRQLSWLGSGFRERNRLDLDANSHEIAMGISVQVPILDIMTKRNLAGRAKKLLKLKSTSFFW